MLFFGHAGITLGAAALAARALKNREANYSGKKSLFAPVTRYLDIRLLLIGSLLPDIIDKPVGQYLFRETFNNGRIFSHTLLFLLLISAAGYLIYKRRKRIWLLTLAAGVFTHIILDEIWNTPETFFWPLMGFTFPQYELEGWGTHLLDVLLSSPYIYISEAVGLAVCIWFAIWLLVRKRFVTFIWRGRIL